MFSAEWLRYEPVPGHSRFYEGYRAILAGWWNGQPEFTVDAVAAAALAATFAAMADYVGADWRTTGFDGRTLAITRPPSMGGGIHPIEAVDGRYRIGWGLPWHRVDVNRYDRVVGRG